MAGIVFVSLVLPIRLAVVESPTTISQYNTLTKSSHLASRAHASASGRVVVQESGHELLDDAPGQAMSKDKIGSSTTAFYREPFVDASAAASVL